MKSLEEIYVEKTHTVLQRGTNGIPQQVSRTFTQKLNVRTIDAGLRFVHLIVDSIIIQIFHYLLMAIPFLVPFHYSIMGITILLFYPLFYTVMEWKFQQTPGKMITGYVVIDKYANAPDFSTCLLRTLCRMVPFEAFSCTSSPSRGWHDKWTKTYVVEKSYVPKLKELLEKHQ